MSDEIRNKDDAKGPCQGGRRIADRRRRLKREGKVDRATGAVKDGVEKVSDKVKDAVGKDRGRDRRLAEEVLGGGVGGGRRRRGRPPP